MANWIKWMEKAGFGSIQSRTHQNAYGRVACGKTWKEVGLLNKMTTEMALKGYFLYKLTSFLGWEYSEVQSWLARVREALMNKANHGYTTWGVAWVQKSELWQTDR
ncbi:S-adenosylmethionine-dependent methyltransferase [Metarhizium rileyi]|uniref:S-adenosylmethionine-dependent methyltransferase n=1 Tax=Metarhizium rileyi (strain RCEF 4871) TaxID=1649241 RepID=A0A166X0U9_METRR|nr:S-adenosylmethionine-dependent methyltransferase [Metarhizium rileyi RCEF 4871]